MIAEGYGPLPYAKETRERDVERGDARSREVTDPCEGTDARETRDAASATGGGDARGEHRNALRRKIDTAYKRNAETQVILRRVAEARGEVKQSPIGKQSRITRKQRDKPSDARVCVRVNEKHCNTPDARESE